jgi:hypothetical protein
LIHKNVRISMFYRITHVLGFGFLMKYHQVQVKIF